jgi:hypothetical protein
MKLAKNLNGSFPCMLQVYGVNSEDNNQAHQACPFTGKRVGARWFFAVKETVGIEGRRFGKAGHVIGWRELANNLTPELQPRISRTAPSPAKRPFQFPPSPFSLPPVFHNGLSAPSVQLQPGSAEPCCLEGRSAREAWLCFSGRLAVHHPVDDSLQRIHGTKEN